MLSRDDRDPAAEPGWKAVEAEFRRTGCILHLHLPGGEVVRTTPEHPFWVEGRGWVQAGALKEGDRLATLSGEWVAVGEVFDTQVWEAVYNLRVADHHTYFVGDDGWGFAVWAHNVSCQEVTAEVIAVTGVQSPFASKPGLAAQIAKNMTDYAANTSAAYRSRDAALAALDELQGVGPATAAKIFWDILLKIGPRYPQAEHGVPLDSDRLKLMEKALYRPGHLEQCVRIVLRPNSDYYLPISPTSNAHYFTDHKGRLQRVEFTLQAGSPTTGAGGNTTWMGHLGGKEYAGGHVVGRQFNGENQYPNLVPMHRYLNAYPYAGNPGGGYGQLEAIWATALNNARDVSDVSITLNFGTDDLRPTSFDIRFQIRSTPFFISFENDGNPLSAQQKLTLDAARAAATAP